MNKEDKVVYVIIKNAFIKSKMILKFCGTEVE